MPTDRRLIDKCPSCGKTLKLESEYQLGDERILNFECGHFFVEDFVRAKDEELDFTSANGNGFIARPYQQDGIKFIIDSDFSCVIGDQMRLGKTPQALLALKNRLAERTPCLIIVKATNLWQWVREFKTWTSTLPLGIYVVQGGQAWIPPGFSAYIISMDTIAIPGTCKYCSHSLRKHSEKLGCKCTVKGCECINKFNDDNKDSILDKLREFDFKLVIADEAHSFKNTDSARSAALVAFLKEKNQSVETIGLKYTCLNCKYEWSESFLRDVDLYFFPFQQYDYVTCPNCTKRMYQGGELDIRRKCGVVLLTGTAIKNRADEYFVPLNLVAPSKFPSLASFRRNWLLQDSKGQYSRINPSRYEAFKKEIAPYVLRREKEDVYSDLPALNRMFTFIEPDRDALVNSYNKILDKIESKLAERADPNFWDMQEHMSQLRRICGLMKLPWACDYLETCMIDSDKSRYLVGIHHKDVRDLLKFKLSHLGSLTLSGEDSAERKDEIMRRFASTPERILIINMLAGGVGMDFHYVNNILVLERQWSFADEEQFEFRAYNPDKSIKTAATDVEYLLIKGSFEEFWHNMVESKKVIQGETIGTHWDLKTQPKLFKQLMEETVGSRL